MEKYLKHLINNQNNLKKEAFDKWKNNAKGITREK